MSESATLPDEQMLPGPLHDAAGPHRAPRLLKIKLSPERLRPNISASIVKSMEDERHCDMDVLCGTKCYAVHRAIFAANSEKFKILLTKECSKWNTRPQIKVEGIDVNIFEAVIDFFYYPSELSDYIRKARPPILSKILAAAKYLGAKGLIYRLNQMLRERVAARASAKRSKTSE